MEKRGPDRSSFSVFPQWEEVSLMPTMPVSSNTVKNIRAAVTGSLKIRMPTGHGAYGPDAGPDGVGSAQGKRLHGLAQQIEAGQHPRNGHHGPAQLREAIGQFQERDQNTSRSPAHARNTHAMQITPPLTAKNKRRPRPHLQWPTDAGANAFVRPAADLY